MNAATLAIDLHAVLVVALAFLRAGAFLMTAPVLGGPGVPLRARLAGAGALAFVLYPFARDGVGDVPEPGSLAAASAAVAEVGVGLAMGLAARLVFLAIQVAASFVEVAVGLDAVQLFDPHSQESEGILPRLQVTIASLALLASNAHHGLIAALARSYGPMPAGQGLPRAAEALGLTRLGAEMIAAGVRLGAPVVLAMLVVNLWTALLARTSPQMNPYFAIGAAFSLAAGLGLLVVAGPAMTRAASWTGDAMAAAALSVAPGD
ncbi:flagellar biosynthetic protein FliR [Myxococcota bacterium]|nr:flagellar biosynthetic protein FliR [Myxococcota bacterium]